MPGANINKEFQFLGDGTEQSLRDNDKAILMALAEIYSNKNLALNIRSFTANATLDVTDSVVLCNTTGGAFSLTLPPANSGSSRSVNKSRLMFFYNADVATTRTPRLCALNAAGSDVIIDEDATSGTSNGVFGASSLVILLSDGNATWYVVYRNERGVFTPTDSSGAGLVFTANSVRWTRINRMVTVELKTTWPVNASGAVAQLNALPYAPIFQFNTLVESNVPGGPPFVDRAIVGFGGATTVLPSMEGNPPGGMTNAGMSGSYISACFSYKI